MTSPTLQQIFDDAYHRDPYPTYARLRAGGGVHPVALPDGSSAWIVTTEAEVRYNPQSHGHPALPDHGHTDRRHRRTGRGHSAAVSGIRPP
ncbi:hypothetical protein GCM10010299_44950 [Streptomyces tanashiensis]|nr:hypothetical protein GCM10010299_44950 [Streptomyces tanashiensis]